jgi:hypothetical protein
MNHGMAQIFRACQPPGLANCGVVGRTIVNVDRCEIAVAGQLLSTRLIGHMLSEKRSLTEPLLSTKALWRESSTGAWRLSLLIHILDFQARALRCDRNV